MFDRGGVVRGVYTLDFPQELDSSLWLAIFGAHETTQAADSDQEKSDLYAHYSHDAPCTGFGQAIPSRRHRLLFKRAPRACMRNYQIHLAHRKLGANFCVVRQKCLAKIKQVSIAQIVILAIVQGLAELLPVSSSAHVVVAEKLLGLDPSSPPMTLLLVMLHTGTMIAVIVYFWQRWKNTYFENAANLKRFVQEVVVATILTALIGEALIKLIEKTIFRNTPQAEIEDLFSHLEIIAPALAIAGLLILVAGLVERRKSGGSGVRGEEGMNTRRASLIGAVQGLCLPFRGFSRSGATISAGMLAGVSKARAENFSFALAVVLTPPVVGREILRLLRFQTHGIAGSYSSAILPSLLGTVLAFVAGLVALRWLSRWLESGRWYLFGVYCLIAAVIVAILHSRGY